MAKKYTSIKKYVNATNHAIPTNLSFFIQEKNGNYVINKPLNQNEIIDLAKYIMSLQFKVGAQLSSMETAKNYLLLHMAKLEKEVFNVLFLDNKNRVLAFECLFEGTINKAAVYPREIAKKALQYNASAIIIAHNHISSSSDPSQADKDLTGKLKEMLEFLEIRVLDHIITAGNTAISFSELGLM